MKYVNSNLPNYKILLLTCVSDENTSNEKSYDSRCSMNYLVCT